VSSSEALVRRRQREAYYGIETSPLLSLPESQWHHLAAVRKDLGLRLYLDGQPVKTNVVSTRNADTMGLSDCWNLVIRAQQQGNLDE